MLEDASRMTRHALMNWIEKKGKNLCASGVYAEFDRKYNRLPGADQHVLDGDKVLLFLKAVDSKDRRELGSLLEDETQPNGLVADWAAVKKACSRLDKCQQWMEEADVESPQPWRRKAPTLIETTKPIDDADKKAMEESIMEELSKKFEAVSLANLGRHGPKGKDAYRCVWCDSLEHSRRDCVDLQDAIRTNIVFLDGYMIHSSETRKPLRVNFGKGGMKKIVEMEDGRHVEAIHYASSAGISVGRENLKTIKPGAGFWPTVFECEKKGKIDSEDLEIADRNMRRVTRWTDPVDDKTTFAEVVCENYEALVEEKRERTGDEDDTSKLPNTRNARTENSSSPATQKEIDEPSMRAGGSSQPARMDVEESAKKGRERAMPTYKLRSDIEQKADLRKVLEEKVLDSHEDLTLRELLGIAKKEFHETNMDLINQKQQQSDEEEAKTSAITMARSDKEEEDEEVITGNHYSRPHWARATTETPVKIGEKKETVVALIDHGSDINIMSTEFHKKGKWSINTNHGWEIRAATKATKDLYGAHRVWWIGWRQRFGQNRWLWWIGWSPCFKSMRRVWRTGRRRWSVWNGWFCSKWKTKSSMTTRTGRTRAMPVPSKRIKVFKSRDSIQRSRRFCLEHRQSRRISNGRSLSEIGTYRRMCRFGGGECRVSLHTRYETYVRGPKSEVHGSTMA
jgi:hypothetical protein